MILKEEIVFYAEDSLQDLFNMIDKWKDQKLKSILVSIRDINIMKEHIEDLESELYGNTEEKIS